MWAVSFSRKQIETRRVASSHSGEHFLIAVKPRKRVLKKKKKVIHFLFFTNLTVGHSPSISLRTVFSSQIYRLRLASLLITDSGEWRRTAESWRRRSCPLLASAWEDHLPECGDALPRGSAARSKRPVFHCAARGDHWHRGSYRIRSELTSFSVQQLLLLQLSGVCLTLICCL